MERLSALQLYLAAHSENWLLGIFVFGCTLLTVMVFNKLLDFLTRRTRRPLFINFLKSMLSVLFILIGFLLSVYVMFGKNIISEMIAGVGLLSIVLGFAFKEIGENFVAGLILAIQTPFKVGDYIENNGIMGHVIEINFRSTHIKTPDGKDVFIPNANLITNNLISYTIDGFLRYGFVIGLEVGVDFDRAKVIIENAVMKSDRILKTDKLPLVYIRDIGSSTTDVQVNFWVNADVFTRTSEHNQIRSEIINYVVQDLVAANYYLPADIMELKNYHTETLRHRAAI